MTDAELGRLFRLKLKRNLSAREDALASIRERPNRRWQARIGGRMRGKTLFFWSRAGAEAAVHEHYNAIMMTWVKGKNG